ncbi:unnamed protein product, partial [Rotaria magnacalcarata]
LSHNLFNDSSAIRVFLRRFGGGAPASCLCLSSATTNCSSLNISMHA